MKNDVERVKQLTMEDVPPPRMDLTQDQPPLRESTPERQKQKEEQKHLNRSTPQITESEISNTQDNWWEKEQTTSKTEFKIEKLVTFSKKSIYVMHFINFDGKENVLLRLLVQIVKFYMNYILQ